MKSFYYIVKSRKGGVSKGVIKAESEADAEELFRKHGYIVLSIEEETKGDRRQKGIVGVSVSNIIKVVAIVILIGAIYAYVELRKHRPSYEKPIFQKLEISPQAKPLIQEQGEEALSGIPGIARESEPEDDVVRIKMRGSQKNEIGRQTSRDSYGDSYHKAVGYYNQGMISRSERALREAIRYAQYVLSSSTSGGVKEEMRKIIRESRKMLWSGKAH